MQRAHNKVRRFWTSVYRMCRGESTSAECLSTGSAAQHQAASIAPLAVVLISVDQHSQALAGVFRNRSRYGPLRSTAGDLVLRRALKM